MSDIVERLRKLTTDRYNTFEQAADEIESLRQRVKSLEITAELQAQNNTTLRQQLAEVQKRERLFKEDVMNCVEELFALKQRVKDGEEMRKATILDLEACQAELAALKQQGEPVGYFVNVNDMRPDKKPNYQQVTDDCAADPDVVALYAAPKPEEKTE